jgi:hypothetical protein
MLIRQVADHVERLVKICAIVGGLAAAINVSIQLEDINHREENKRIEDWQNAVVYRIIATSKAPLTLGEISLRYTSEAQKFEPRVPAEKLDDSHLQLVLLRLIAGSAVNEPSLGTYSVRIEKELFDYNDMYSIMNKLTNQTNLQAATHTQLAIEQILQANSPLTPDQLMKRMVAVGGDASYLQNNLPVLLQQLSDQRRIEYLGDGRIVAEQMYTTATPVYSVPSPDADIVSVLPRIQPYMIRFIMSHRPGSAFDECLSDISRDDILGLDSLKKVSDIGVITISDTGWLKDKDGRSCATGVHIQTTHTFDAVWDYYFSLVQVSSR